MPGSFSSSADVGLELEHGVDDLGGDEAAELLGQLLGDPVRALGRELLVESHVVGVGCLSGHRVSVTRVLRYSAGAPGSGAHGPRPLMRSATMRTSSRCSSGARKG